MIVILGGGPAGRIASIRLASAGKDVLLIERGGIGGQCLHFGCMPVCALNDVARFVHSARTFNTLGIIDSVPDISFSSIFSEMRKIQEKIASVLDTETRSAGVNIIYGKSGRLEGKEVFAGDEQIDAEAVIAATGSRPNIPAYRRDKSRGSIHPPYTLWYERTPKKTGDCRGKCNGC